ncbi:TPA: hypothetical protein I7730_16350 [Vibrio vulnificus]|uniref:Uncharacterized protein n=1 Tax=Vibrio vulnificus TaxID=672 RepID=A0A8H9N1Z6_VIBVL|nr:hypothetical protein [Vibrio vulnificus]HAS8541356.1 hypothetical protein [Vibrio vulnificus]
MKIQTLCLLCLALSLGSNVANAIEASDIQEKQWLVEEFQYKYGREPGEIEYFLINMVTIQDSTFIDVKNAAMSQIEKMIGDKLEQKVARCKTFDEIIEVVAKVSKKGR